MNQQVQHHPDRVSVSFAPDGPDVDWIITVTFDNRIADKVDDNALVMMARERLSAFTAVKGIEHGKG